MLFRSLTLLGSTGSIGTQTLDVVRRFRDRMTVVGLSASGRRIDLLARQIIEFSPTVVHVHDASRVPELRALVGSAWKGEVLTGTTGLRAMAAEADADLVVVATVGWTGLEPALAALEANRHLALANKEVLVCGGDLVMEAARQRGRLILPIDSEHNAIHQCLATSPGAALRRLILTCSGGPYRNATLPEIEAATSRSTLNHPTWDMGPKITVDSATLMNKGFEVIEAHHLFGVDYGRIEVVVHPQSVVHSMAEFVDGSMLAQLGQTDMRLPIQYALTYPDRMPGGLEPLDLARVGRLDFSAPDTGRFPCLRMAYEAGRAGGSMTCVLNAANEVAVGLHLEDRLTCGGIPRVVASVLEAHRRVAEPTLEELRECDRWARAHALEASGRLATV